MCIRDRVHVVNEGWGTVGSDGNLGLEVGKAQQPGVWRGGTSYPVQVGVDGTWSLDLGEVGDGSWKIKVEDGQGIEPPITFGWRIWIDPDTRAAGRPKPTT